VAAVNKLRAKIGGNSLGEWGVLITGGPTYRLPRPPTVLEHRRKLVTVLGRERHRNCPENIVNVASFHVCSYRKQPTATTPRHRVAALFCGTEARRHVTVPRHGSTVYRLPCPRGMRYRAGPRK
jgi:hypothetical protein